MSISGRRILLHTTMPPRRPWMPAPRRYHC
jgi:hypothetical protein